MSKTAIAASAEQIAERCVQFISEQLHMPAGQVDPDAEFDDFGLDSVLVTALLMELEEWLGTELPPSLVFEEPTVGRLSRVVAGRLEGARS